MVEITTPLTYVALLGQFPVAVSRVLDTVQEYAQTRERQHNYEDGSQREFRWDEIEDAGQAWRLMAKNPRTNRWGQTSYVVRLAAVLDPAP
jgi:hypothetical protein